MDQSGAEAEQHCEVAYEKKRDLSPSHVLEEGGVTHHTGSNVRGAPKEWAGITKQMGS